jgi:hypothetical protein
MTKINTLLKVIELKHKSFDQPNFSFVKETVSANPYQSLIDELMNIFEIKDITDINDDVSFNYLLSSSDRQWVVELSMVGLYAIILKKSDTGSLELVTADTTMQEEQIIMSLLINNKFDILEKEILEHPCPLKLFNTEPENVSIFQALFSDTDLYPWKSR